MIHLPTFICKCKKPCAFVETISAGGEYSVLVKCINCEMYCHAISHIWEILMEMMIRQWKSSGGRIVESTKNELMDESVKEKKYEMFTLVSEQKYLLNNCPECKIEWIHIAITKKDEEKDNTCLLDQLSEFCPYCGMNLTEYKKKRVPIVFS